MRHAFQDVGLHLTMPNIAEHIHTYPHHGRARPSRPKIPPSEVFPPKAVCLKRCQNTQVPRFNDSRSIKKHKFKKEALSCSSRIRGLSPRHVEIPSEDSFRYCIVVRRAKSKVLNTLGMFGVWISSLNTQTMHLCWNLVRMPWMQAISLAYPQSGLR